MSESVKRWADLTAWHVVEEPWGAFEERVSLQALNGLPLDASPSGFRVLEEEWDLQHAPPRRVIRRLQAQGCRSAIRLRS